MVLTRSISLFGAFLQILHFGCGSKSNRLYNPNSVFEQETDCAQNVKCPELEVPEDELMFHLPQHNKDNRNHRTSYPVAKLDETQTNRKKSRRSRRKKKRNKDGSYKCATTKNSESPDLLLSDEDIDSLDKMGDFRSHTQFTIEHETSRRPNLKHSKRRNSRHSGSTEKKDVKFSPESESKLTRIDREASNSTLYVIMYLIIAVVLVVILLLVVCWCLRREKGKCKECNADLNGDAKAENQSQRESKEDTNGDKLGCCKGCLETLRRWLKCGGIKSKTKSKTEEGSQQQSADCGFCDLEIENVVDGASSPGSRASVTPQEGQGELVSCGQCGCRN